MGTRADFYVGHGREAEWLGSLAFDGYGVYEVGPGSDVETCAVAYAKFEEHYRVAVRRLLASVDRSTTPEQGWPWPWEDSRLTDFAYCFVDGTLECYCFGRGPVRIGEPFADDDATPKAPFPDMTARQRVTYGPRSGLIVVTLPGREEAP